jgi:hypothetical protein
MRRIFGKFIAEQRPPRTKAALVDPTMQPNDAFKRPRGQVYATLASKPAAVEEFIALLDPSRQAARSMVRCSL